MNDRIKAKIEQTRQFVRKHPTFVACVATGLISAKLSREITMNDIVERTSKVLYAAGYENGTLEMQRNILLDFVQEKGLLEELAARRGLIATPLEAAQG